MDRSVIDVDALLASTPPDVFAAHGKARAATIPLTPLVELPPVDAGIVAALGSPEAHAGRKWHVVGAVAGLMRKCGMRAERCEAVIREWLAPIEGPGVDVAHAIKHALGAWTKPAEEVSGPEALASLIGAEHAEVVNEAILRTARPRRALARPEPAPDVFAPARPAEVPASTFTGFDLTRQGTPRPTTLNTCRALEAWFGERIKFDECRGRVLVSGVDESLGRFPDGLWTDVHTTAFQVLCEQHQLYVGPTVASAAVTLHSHEYSFNPLSDFLLQCYAEWDGAARVDQALANYWRCDDTDATRACSRVWLLSLAARGLTPGVKVDTALVLLGEQGLYKTQSLQVMAGGRDWYSGSPLPIGDKDAMQNIRGKWLWEIGENTSVSRRDANAVKAFLDQEFDTFRASYGHFSEDVPRTCTFAVTSNHVEILNDPTGARRWLPVTARAHVDLDGLRRDRVQILGEAVARLSRGEQHWPTPAEKAALAPVHDRHTEGDPWEELIGAWISKREARAPGAPLSPFSIADVFGVNGPLPVADAQLDRGMQTRAAICLRRLGFEREHTRDGKRWVRVRGA